MRGPRHPVASHSATQKQQQPQVINFGPQSAAPANFAGTIALTFGQSGDFRAVSSFAGSIPVVFAQTGAFSAVSSYGGTIPATFAQTGDFRGVASFGGSIPVVFDQTGDFDAVSSFAGSIPVTFSQTGDFDAVSSFAGSIPVVFNQTGDFVAAPPVADATVIGGSWLPKKVKYLRDGREIDLGAPPEVLSVPAIPPEPDLDDVRDIAAYLVEREVQSIIDSALAAAASREADMQALARGQAVLEQQARDDEDALLAIMLAI